MNRRKTAAAALTLALAAFSGTGAAFAQDVPAASGIDLVTVPSPDSPLVSIRLMFNAGSMYDPKGKEGLASLTALMVGQASTQRRTYGDLTEALYPMAANVAVLPDREVASFATTVHRETLASFTGLLQEMILQPAFSENDFNRNKQQLQAALTQGLRSASDELLGLEAIQDEIFQGHPYGHPTAGTVQGLQSITLDDVKRFYQERYTQANLMLGVAGGYPQGYPESLQKALSVLPRGGERKLADLPPVPKTQGRNFNLIDKKTSSVGMNVGFALPINRTHPDFYPLLVANSYLGEHRTFYGRLMQQLRGKRGLNYGDYSYLEFWASPPFTDNPAPGVPRRQQYFSFWIRPVVPADAQFALRAALNELQLLHDKGLSQQDFELTRNYLVNRKSAWVQTLSDRLGYTMDSRYYGMPYYIDELDKRLKALTLDDVNKAVKKYLSPDNFEAVVVTGDAQRLKDILQKDEPSPKTYISEVDKDILEVDKTIQSLKVKPTAVDIVPIQQVFEK